MPFVDERENSTETDELLNSEVCINCSSYYTKIVDENEIICTGCGAVSDDVTINDTDELVRILYMHNQDVYNHSHNSSSSLSGAGNTIITTYDKAMDFSKSGIISGRISNTDSNNKRIGVSYSKLAYTERNNLKNISTNREINITEGITTILKIT